MDADLAVLEERMQHLFPKKFSKLKKKYLTIQVLSDSILLAHGGIAQLGERLNGIQEVSGSIPLISTKKKTVNK